MDAPSRRDSSLTSQMNMFLRTRSDSGKKLNDDDILRQIKVKNLDTGEEMDLVEAEDQLPQVQQYLDTQIFLDKLTFSLDNFLDEQNVVIF